MLIKSAIDRGVLHGIKIFHRAPMLSRLLFADDCFLFFRAEMEEVRVMKEVLDVYAKASGQQINMDKSEIFFTGNMDDASKFHIVDMLQAIILWVSVNT